LQHMAQNPAELAGLEIYRFPDGTYEATRNNHLYTFRWNNFHVQNFHHIGGINRNWVPQGQLLRRPHIQMILQVQNAINAIHESVIKVYENLKRNEKN